MSSSTRRERRGTSTRPPRALARGLGLFSLGMGLAQLLAPDEVARRAGLDDDRSARGVLQLVGVRELLVVPGLLRAGAPGGWLRLRLAGDVMDLALLGVALDGKRGSRRDRTTAATAAVLGVTALDLLAARRSARATRPLYLTAAVTVRTSPQEAYAFWRDLTHLPAFMQHLQEVRPAADGRTTWRAKAPVGRITWEAEVVEDEPGRRIAWRSVGRTAVPNSGSVDFAPAPGDRGTEVRVTLDYGVPLGRLGARVARLLGEEPHQQVEDDLRRFKQVLETGKVVRSDGSPEGTSSRRAAVQRPAHPVRA